MNKKLLTTALVAGCAAAQAAEKPNVLLIYIDDMGIGDVSCYGDAYLETPNIDQLAKEGIKFEQYYSSAPVSSASRSGLTTGQYPLRCGITSFLNSKKMNAKYGQRDFLESSRPSMGRAFQNAGYNTAHIGKWHMGGGRDVVEAPQITEYGFDFYLSTYESPDPDPKITATDWIWSDKDEIKRWDRTRYFVDTTLDYIEKQSNTNDPFFINLWLDDMHTPWVPEASVAKKKKTWQQEVSFEPVLAELDVQIGRLMDGLKRLGVDENTIIIFTSDNGPSPSFEYRRTTGLRGEKNSLYEAGIRMPFIIRYPEKIRGNRVNSKSVVCAVDLYPSLCSMAGIELEQGYDGDGEELSKVLLGKSNRKRKQDLMWDFGHTPFYNFPKDPHQRSPHLAIRRDEWKLLTNADGSVVELYNLIEDRAETKDVAAEHPKMVKELSTKVIAWFNEYKYEVTQ